MSSFATHRRRLTDAQQPPYRRLSNLRSCILHFSPCGFRSTYFYLTVSAGIPRNLDADPASLIRAADELHEARTLWLTGLARLQQQRREAKDQGNRALPDASWWTRYGNVLTYSSDLCRHPNMTLAAFVRRQLDRAAADLPDRPSCDDEGEAAWAARLQALWPAIWERRHMGDDGRPNPRWPGWTDSFPLPAVIRAARTDPVSK